jgi:hypothetical protein
MIASGLLLCVRIGGWVTCGAAGAGSLRASFGRSRARTIGRAGAGAIAASAAREPPRVAPPPAQLTSAMATGAPAVREKPTAHLGCGLGIAVAFATGWLCIVYNFSLSAWAVRPIDAVAATASFEVIWARSMSDQGLKVMRRELYISRELKDLGSGASFAVLSEKMEPTPSPSQAEGGGEWLDLGERPLIHRHIPSEQHDDISVMCQRIGLVHNISEIQ